MMTTATKLLIAFLAFSGQWQNAAASECEGRLDNLDAVGKLSSDPNLDWFQRNGHLQNECLLKLLSNRTLRKNPWVFGKTDQVTKAEVALYVIAEINGIPEHACAPDDLVAFLESGRTIASSHWFYKAENLQRLRKRCEIVLAQLVPGGRGALSPRIGSTDHCLADIRFNMTQAEMIKLTKHSSGCLASLVAETVTVRAPSWVSTQEFVPIGDWALLALHLGKPALVERCFDGMKSRLDAGTIETIRQDRRRVAGCLVSNT